ncbi:MAG: cysteine-rich VLP protein [Hominilimicola sp.]
MAIENLLSIERKQNGALPHMTSAQRKRANALIHKLCCNYIDGECIALDCECVQCNSYSVCCKWFRQAILPQDKALLAEIIEPQNTKHCVICGKAFVPKSNRAKYCSDCAVKERRIKKARNERKYRELKRGHLRG